MKFDKKHQLLRLLTCYSSDFESFMISQVALVMLLPTYADELASPNILFLNGIAERIKVFVLSITKWK